MVLILLCPLILYVPHLLAAAAQAVLSRNRIKRRGAGILTLPSVHQALVTGCGAYDFSTSRHGIDNGKVTSSVSARSQFLFSLAGGTTMRRCFQHFAHTIIGMARVGLL